jgi:tripartite-type tricarboxylate transporter receptor subunit TctC
MPKDVADKLNAEVNKALNGDMKAKLTEQGLLLTPGSIEDFVHFQQDDTVKVAKIIKDANIKAE